MSLMEHSRAVQSTIIQIMKKSYNDDQFVPLRFTEHHTINLGVMEMQRRGAQYNHASSRACIDQALGVSGGEQPT